MATLIFDLDGVIWHRKVLVNPRIPSLIKKLRRERHEIYFLTNNSSLNRHGYQRKLAGLGIKAERGKIICTAHATRMYLEKKVAKSKPTVFVIGEKPLRKEIEKLPVRFAGIDDDIKVDYVIVGIDWHFNYKKLNRAMQAILGGAKFIATNADRTFPVRNRRVSPGCGSILAAIKTATNRRPYIIGKPNPFIVRHVFNKLAGRRKDVYIVGDRLDTDIVIANRLGVHSVLVLTGTTTPEMVKKAKGLHKPEYVINNVTEIRKVLKPRI